MTPVLPLWKRILLISAGMISVAVGVIALFIPLLPTTPFLLLAAACFIRSSDRFYNWLINHKWFGPYIRNYREKGGMTRRHKIATLVTFWGGFLISAFVFIPIPLLRLIPILLCVLVTWYLLKIPTVK